MQILLKFAGMPQTGKLISAASGPYVTTTAPISDCPTEPRPIATAQRTSLQSCFSTCDLYVGIFPRCDVYVAHPGSNANAVTPREPKFTKKGEDLSG